MGRVLVEKPISHPKFPRLKLERRANSRFYQQRTFLDGKVVQKSTKTADLNTAFKLAEVWYRDLLRASVSEKKRHSIDRLVAPTVSDVFKAYKDQKRLPDSQRKYALMKWSTIADFWRTIRVTDVTPETFEEFFTWRRRYKTRSKTTVKNHTIHKDVMVIRQILKFAIQKGYIDSLPFIPKIGKIDPNPRPWLARDEWLLLSVISQDRIKEAPNARVREQRQDLRDQMIWVVASMMRIGEMLDLRFQDCRVEALNKKEEILICQVNGKRGHRTVVAPQECVDIWKRRQKGRKESDRIFPVHHRDAFRELLDYTELRIDSKTGEQRNFKSLRATGISLRILGDPDNPKEPNLLMISKNAGTSYQSIDNFYAKRLTAEHGRKTLGQSLNLDFYFG